MKKTEDQEELIKSYEIKDKSFVDPVKAGIYIIREDHKVTIIRGRLEFNIGLYELTENFHAGLSESFFISMKFLAAAMLIGKKIGGFPKKKKKAKKK